MTRLFPHPSPTSACLEMPTGPMWPHGAREDQDPQPEPFQISATAHTVPVWGDAAPTAHHPWSRRAPSALAIGDPTMGSNGVHTHSPMWGSISAPPARWGGEEASSAPPHGKKRPGHIVEPRPFSSRLWPCLMCLCPREEAPGWAPGTRVSSSDPGPTHGNRGRSSPTTRHPKPRQHLLWGRMMGGTQHPNGVPSMCGCSVDPPSPMAQCAHP